MKIYKKKIIPSREVEEVSNRKCDLCGKETKGTDWTNELYNIDKTNIYIKIKKEEGYSFPEGGYTSGYDIDLCPDCFMDKLIPWLISQGATIEEKDF